MGNPRNISRRSITWGVPAVAVTAAAPAFAVSPSQCAPRSWYAQSDYVPGTLDSSNRFINSTEDMSSTPPGMLTLQHFGYAETPRTFRWRLNLVLPNGAAPGAEVRIPVDDTWEVLTTTTVGYERRIFGPPEGLPRETDAAGRTFALVSLAGAYTASVTAGEVVIRFPQGIPENGGGAFGFTVRALAPVQEFIDVERPEGEQVIQSRVMSGEAFVSFSDFGCPPT